MCTQNAISMVIRDDIDSRHTTSLSGSFDRIYDYPLSAVNHMAWEKEEPLDKIESSEWCFVFRRRLDRPDAHPSEVPLLPTSPDDISSSTSVGGPRDALWQTRLSLWLQRDSDLLSASETKRILLQVCRARDLSMGNPSHLPSMYNLERMLEAPVVTFGHLREKICAGFLSFLRSLGCTVTESISSNHALLFIKVHLTDSLCQQLAARFETQLRLHRDHSKWLAKELLAIEGDQEVEYTKYSPVPAVTACGVYTHREFRFALAQEKSQKPPDIELGCMDVCPNTSHQPDLVPPVYLVFNEYIERQSNRDVWMRYDRLGRELVVPYVPSNEVSIFRPVDKIRLLKQAVEPYFSIETMEGYGIMEAAFPLHQPVLLQSLRENWASPVWFLAADQPLHLIRDYFGEKIAFYFAWAQFFTVSLWPPAIIGACVTAVQLAMDFRGRFESNVVLVSSIAFSAYMVVWSSVFIIRWNARQAKLIDAWGAERPKTSLGRSDFQFDSILPDPTDPVGIQRVYSPYKSQLRMLFSLTITLLFMGTTIGLVALSFSLPYLASLYGFKTVQGREKLLTSFANAVVVLACDNLWSILAPILTAFENHKYDDDYDRSYVLKMFSFRIVNNFYALAYLAFVKQFADPCGADSEGGCLPTLRVQLLVLFVVNFGRGCLEILRPTASYLTRKACSIASKKSSTEDQLRMDKYDASGHDMSAEDFVTLVVHFGHATLFSIVLPILPLLCYVYYLSQIRIDAYKLTVAYRRPYPVQVAGIGPNESIVTLMSYLAVLTNLGMCVFQMKVGRGLELWERLMVFLVAEHVVLTVKWYLQYKLGRRDQAVHDGRAQADAVIRRALYGEGEILTKPMSEVQQ